MPHLVAVTVMLLAALSRPAAAQCPDGAPPPCASVRTTQRLPPLDPDLVAILPFRVTGADASLGYLRDGMVELLAAQFAEGSPRAVDPGTALRAWQRAGGSSAPLDQAAALRLARQLGAGQLMVGAVVGTSRRLTLTASIVRVPDGGVRVPPVRAEGDGDSLGVMVAQLTAGLLSRGTAAWRLTAGDPGTTNIEALRAYLEGMRDYRVGAFAATVRSFARALEVDSTFTLAAYMGLLASGWGSHIANYAHVQALAWSGRERLGPGERAVLLGVLGTRYPEPSSHAEIIAARERAVTQFPQSAEAWHFLGEEYFHYGAVVGLTDNTARAQVALSRSLEIDTTLGTVSHLIELAARNGDGASSARFNALATRFGPSADQAEFILWIDAASRADRPAMAAARNRMVARRSVQLLVQAVIVAQMLGLPLAEADSAAAQARELASTDAERNRVGAVATVLDVNAGRWQRVRERSLRADSSLLLGALSWTGLADSALAMLDRTPAAPSQRPGASCRLGAFRLERGDTAVGALAAASPTLCADLLRASVQAEVDGSASPLRRLDSLLRQGPPGWSPYHNLLLARLLARHGDYRAAVAAVHRRAYNQGASDPLLAVSLRDGGRWAALAGDTTTAIRDLRHYLVLRAAPDAELIPERDSVRAELVRLERR